jgi:hypothetical protein
MKCRSCWTILLLFLAWLGLVLVGCGHRSSLTRSSRQEAEKKEWQTATSAEQKQQAVVDTKKVVLTNRRTVTRKPDGTVIDEVTAQQVIDLATLQFVATGSASKSATGASEKKIADSNEKRSETGQLPSPWWLAPIILVICVGQRLVRGKWLL